ncbi:7399_t:CDS:2 [Funneliformis geosporum]|uniref:8587_t:CDS:1 n=1 Tax=Funneliformis geosporum TaxID=1117311 RepID=A0A9W4SJM0_9GLOM|nr:8587_t:CDS:2 [Funneliformis geosporum]CAI2181469.1 7399_t:CDS:2 [Funneliformis geosporum]
MFISFRKEMMKYKPYNNMPMTKYSKFVSERWKNLSEEAKVELQRQYQINRDQKLRRERVTIADQCIANHERTKRKSKQIDQYANVAWIVKVLEKQRGVSCITSTILKIIDIMKSPSFTFTAALDEHNVSTVKTYIKDR